MFVHPKLEGIGSLPVNVAGNGPAPMNVPDEKLLLSSEMSIHCSMADSVCSSGAVS